MEKKREQQLPTPPVSAETAALVSKEWHSYIEPLLPVAERLAGYVTDINDPQLRHEYYRNLYSQLSMGFFALLHADTEHPDLWSYFNQAFNALAPNPDFDYYVSPLNDRGVYRISGFRGTVKRIGFQTGTGQFIPRGIVDDQKLGKTLANYDVDDLNIGPKGEFDVILSPIRPDGYTGDWWELHPSASYLFVRQMSYDWINEIDGRFGIERLDTPAIRPRATVESLQKNLGHIAAWTEGTVKVSADFVPEMTAGLESNQIGFVDMLFYGGIFTQRYAYGVIELEPDEVLIIESKVPDESRYWSFHLLDMFAFTIDWMNRQSSLNGHTATIDKDGYFRAVISEQDPGVPNWLDNAGYRKSFIQIRWEKCSSWPDHAVKKVKLSELREHLPADTAVVTPEQRDAAIRLRRKGAQMRKRW